MRQTLTREDWLMKLTERMRPHFKAAGFPLPKKLRVGVGWPSRRAMASASGRRCMGECWVDKSSTDRHWNVVVSLNLADSRKVAGTLIHELAHAATKNCGHKGEFISCIKMIGLLGTPTLSDGLGTPLRPIVARHMKSHRRYPHGSVDGVTGRKKQGTRLIKLSCQDCGYTVRTTMKWIEVGIPTCCCGGMFGLGLGKV